MWEVSISATDFHIKSTRDEGGECTLLRQKITGHRRQKNNSLFLVFPVRNSNSSIFSLLFYCSNYFIFAVICIARRRTSVIICCISRHKMGNTNPRQD
jgi:hypothetical protein